MRKFRRKLQAYSGTALSPWDAGAAVAILAAMASVTPARAGAAEAPAVVAQAAAPATTGASSELQEVIITARRKAENAQTVPVSVSAFDSRALINNGVHSTNDLQRLVPGVIFHGAGGEENTTYTIRGQTKNVTGPGLPSVITYFNEVPLSSWGSILPTFDVSNVQILKGPQGTLFGRNTTGGAVLVYSNPPTFSYGGYLEGELGNYNEHSLQGAINLPVVDEKFAVRAAFDIERRDGYTRNISTGQDNDNINSNAVRLSALFKPTDWLTNTTVFDLYESANNNVGNIILNPVVNPGLDSIVAGIRSHGPYTTESNIRPYDDARIWGVSNTTKVEFGGMTAKNIFGYRSTGVSLAGSGTGLDIVPLAISVPGLGLTAGTPGVPLNNYASRHDGQISDEVQLSGTALHGAVNWLTGAFYLDDEPTGGTNYVNLDLYRPTTPSATTLAIVNGFLGGVWPIGSQSNDFYTDESKAVFGNVNYDLSKVADFLKGIKLNAGVRYTWDTEGVCADSRPGTLLSTGAFVDAPETSMGACQANHGGFVVVPANSYFPSFNSSANFHAPTYTFGIDYAVNDDVFLYFTTRRGYRAGGLNSPTMAPVLSAYQTFQPQTVTDYEIGAHTKWRLDGWRGRFDIAAFTGSFNQLQLELSGLNAGSLPGLTAANAPSNSGLTINVGDAVVRGVEVDGVVIPFKDLNISYAASYLDAHYSNLDVPSFLSPFFNAGPITGTPRWSYSVNGRYQLPVSETLGDFFASAEYYYIGQEFEGFALVPSYGITNFSLEWRNIHQKPLDLTLFVDNAFDAIGVHGVGISVPNFGVYTGNYVPPRMFGARLRYAFGS